jgi:hypothetical protein
VYPEPWVGDLFYTAGFLLVVFAAIAAIYIRGRRRAFLVGFLILFGGYGYFSLWSWGETRNMLMLSYAQPGVSTRNLAPSLITTRLLAYAYEGLNPDFLSGRRVSTGRKPPATPQEIFGQYMTFMVIGHTIIGLGLGILGGRVAQRLAGLPPATAKKPLEEILKEMDLQ